MFKKNMPGGNIVAPNPRHTRLRRVNQRVFKACLIGFLSLMLLSATAFGQTTASLSGTIMDTSRAVLPGAGILAVNEDTGVETRTTANNAGVYSFPSLQPGTYRVPRKQAGFSDPR